MNSISNAPAPPVPVEISFAGTVSSAPRFFIGSNTHACHETFSTRTDDGRALQVVDNVDLAPRVPVVPGDRIAVRGELVRDRQGAAVVHWTHHDPAGRHADGWIDLRGRRYA